MIGNFEILEHETSLAKSAMLSRHAVFEDFVPGCIAIFCPRQGSRLVYEAVNIGCPDYILTDQCLQEFKALTERRIPIIATIVLITPVVAGKSNPYGYPEGHKFFDVIAQRTETKR
jgi:hypothetical protein